MGTAYGSVSVSGYNASPPPDDGTQSAANQVKWATIKAKLPDPLKTAIEAIDAGLVTAFDYSVVSKSANYTTTAADHMRTVDTTGTTTISLGDAATMGAKYITRVKNSGSGEVTVSRATGGDTLDGATKDLTLAPGQSVICGVSGSGYITHNGNSPIYDHTDPSKSVAFDVSGVTTGTQRSLAIPDRSSTIATLGGAQTFTGAITLSSTLAVTGSVTFTSTTGHSDTVTITKSDNTSASVNHLVLERGDGSGTDFNIATTGDTSNGAASLQFKLGSTAKMTVTTTGINSTALGITTPAAARATKIYSQSGTVADIGAVDAGATCFDVNSEVTEGAMYLAWVRVQGDDETWYTSHATIVARGGTGGFDVHVTNDSSSQITFGETGGVGVYQVMAKSSNTANNSASWYYIKFGV